MIENRGGSRRRGAAEAKAGLDESLTHVLLSMVEDPVHLGWGFAERPCEPRPGQPIQVTQEQRPAPEARQPRERAPHARAKLASRRLVLR